MASAVQRSIGGKNLLTITGEAKGRRIKKRGTRALSPEYATSPRDKIILILTTAWRIRSRSAWRVMGSAPWGSTDISTCRWEGGEQV